MAKISKIKIQGVTHEIKDNEAYVKPASGIPASDIANGVIPDVSAFITKSVNDLTNYYTKSQTYTQTEVNNLIGAINQFKYEIAASTSDVTSPQNNVLYLIGPTGSGTDRYEEYVYTTDWVKIGDTSINLSDYVTTTALNSALADYTLSVDIPVEKGTGTNSVQQKGTGATASNNGSHAEGHNVEASGQYSHAEGDGTEASGDYSHAEGVDTVALGTYSHAEGADVQASGIGSHAEGGSTVASGNYSHTEGGYTSASNDFEHAQGKYNATASGQIFSIGCGDSEASRKNAVSVITGSNPSASVFVYGIGNYDGTNPEPGVNDLATAVSKPATSTSYGTVKTNPDEGIILNASGNLQVLGRLGQMTGGTGIFAPNTIKPEKVGDGTLLITEANNITIGKKSLGVVTGAALNLKSAAAAGATQYVVKNTFTNRFLGALAALPGSRIALNEATATKTAKVVSVQGLANGEPYSSGSSDDIVITVDTSVNPSASTSQVRVYCGADGFSNLLIGQAAGNGNSGNGCNIIAGQQIGCKSGNANLLAGASIFNTGNGNAILGRQHISKQNRWLMAGTGHDNTNGRAEVGTALGQFSLIRSSSNFVIGNGSSETNRKNLFEIESDGKIYVQGLGSYDGTNPQSGVNDLVTVVQTETDPTVPEWAKASTKPSYSFSEIEGTVADSQLPDTISSDITGTAMGLKTEKLTDQEFVFRKSPASIKAKSLTLNKILGKTLAWNQRYSNSRASGDAALGITFQRVDKYSFYYTGTASDTNEISQIENTISGHKYYFSCFNGDGIYLKDRRTTNKSLIATADASTTIVGVSFLSGKTYSSSTVFKPIFIDLTLMFGAGNEPSTVAEFESMFPGYHSYEPGKLISNDAESIETVGFNQWDESQRVNGYYISNTTGAEAAASNYSHTGYVPVLPSTTYYLMGVTSKQWGAYYDANKNFISGYTFSSPGTFTTPANAAYVRITMLATDVSSNVCINLSDPAKNGTYEPYRKSTMQLNLGSFQVRDSQGNVTTITGGLKSDRSGKYDEIVGGKFIQRAVRRAYQSGDENDQTVVTDGTYTDYGLATPVEYELVFPLVPIVKAGETEARISPNSDGLSAPFYGDITYSVADYQDISGKEDKYNKVTSISSSSTDTQYPSAKAVYTGLSEKIDKMVNITWSNLKSLRDSGGLIPGEQYRITDYVTTTIQENTQSAGHQFDIIVTADSTNKLNEEAKAIIHNNIYDITFSDGITKKCYFYAYYYPKDTTKYYNFVDCDTLLGVDEVVDGEFEINESQKTIFTRDYTYSSMEITGLQYNYFKDCNLEAWKLNYCLDNDTTRFAWADSTNGKGVIYWMKDEWNNECPYDFKNIQFKRYKITACPKSPSLVGQYSVNGIDGITVDTTTTYWCYTFTWIDADDEIEDLTIVGQTLPNDEGHYDGVFDNKIESLCSYQLYLDDPSSFTFALSNNCFISIHEYDGGLFYGCYANRLGSNCYYNTFGNSCSSNTFGNDCSYNTFGYSCRYNTFGIGCSYNTFGVDYSSNTFGNYCNYNTFGNYCGYNTFGNSYGSNLIGNLCSYNTFGNYCGYNTFGNDCSYNTFGNYCGYNTFGNHVQESQFGDRVEYFSIVTSEMDSVPTASDVKSYIRWLIVENGVRYVNAYVTTTTSSSLYCQNVRICLGIKGTRSDTRKLINISSCVGSTVNNVYQPADSQIINV